MSLRSASTNVLRSVARSSTAARPLSTIARPALASATRGRAVTRKQHAPAATFSTSSARREEFENPFGINSLAKMSEEEIMLQEAVKRFAQDVVQPKSEEMDENEKMDPEIIKGLFEQGLMAIETDPEMGGAGGSFTSAIIVIEGEWGAA